MNSMDSKGRPHSFNDEPAVTDNTTQRWYFHGKLNRGNDKPAVIESKFNLQRWVILENSHRINGPASVILKQETKSWALYDLIVSEEQHSEIVNYAHTQKIPVWVSFLLYMEAFSLDNVKMLEEATDNWVNPIPIKWMLAATGITDKELEIGYNNPKFLDVYGYTYGYFTEDEDETDLMKRFISIVNYENNIPLAEEGK